MLLFINAFVSGAGSLRLEFRPGQIGHSVANDSPPLRHFFERSWLPQGNEAEMSTAKSLQP